VAGAAVLLGAALTQSALPWFNGMLEGFLTMRLDFAACELWAALLGLAVLVTGLAGLYPAFFLARFQPVETLKGRLAARPAGARLRSGLVLFQFTLTVFLLACTLTIHRQVHHMRALGFDFGATPVVAVPASGEAFEDREAGRSAMQTLRDELRRDPAVAAASLSWGFPGAYWNTSTLRLGGTEERINVRTNWVDAHYFDLYGIDLVAGRGFAEARPGDGDRVAVVNEAFLEAFEWDTYEGKTLHPNYDATWEVVGVVEDFAYAAPTQPLGPVVHVFDGEPGFGWLSVRAATDDPQAVLALLEAAWPGTGARRALTTTFADDHYGEQFVAQDALLAFVTYAAGFAFVIAFIGLVGLAMLLAVQRTKEIGVRKVLGASVGQLVVLLVRGTAALVGGAAVLAAPLAVLVMGAWLEQYPYRVEVGAGPLVLVAALVLAAALLAVGGQAVRAAQADPVQALRSE
ncbi:MAG: ABC transporter permease, partial [Rhodothermales bacterium]|nr:ABC transporter permease [Rhodothermales bacterium]